MKTTKAHFVLFAERVEYYVTKFGLKGWELYFDHQPAENKEQSCGVTWDTKGRCATFGLNTSVSVKPTNEWINQKAFHLAGHLFLGRLDVIARDRHLIEDELEEEIHAVIRTLENVML